jgi:hypothetical protein
MREQKLDLSAASNLYHETAMKPDPCCNKKACINNCHQTCENMDHECYIKGKDGSIRPV